MLENKIDSKIDSVVSEVKGSKRLKSAGKLLLYAGAGIILFGMALPIVSGYING